MALSMCVYSCFNTINLMKSFVKFEEKNLSESEREYILWKFLYEFIKICQSINLEDSYYQNYRTFYTTLLQI